MIVKKKSLILFSIILAVVAILSVVLAVSYIKEVKAERERIEKEERFNRAVERVYKELVREYDSIVETINDYDYSRSLRYKYVVKLNELLAFERYKVSPGSVYETVDRCVYSLRYNRDKDLARLKVVASLKVSFGVD